jgi:hypothetical protein
MLAGSSNTVTTIQSNGTTAITIDASQNVGIGTASPTQELDVRTATDYQIALGSTAGANYAIGRSTTTGFLGFYGSQSGYTGYTFGGADGERMRINASGKILVGTTAEFASGDSQMTIKQNDSAGLYRCLSLETTFAGQRIVQTFINPNGTVGTITLNGSTTTYATSSDYRLKEDVVPMTGALDKVALLNPVTYKWKSNGSAGQGFIAHELQEVCPDAVNGEKDALNKDGDIEPQGIDTSFLVATLTAAIQELKAIVDAQALEIAALKAAP